MKNKAVIILIFVLPILMGCQSIEMTKTGDFGVENMSFDRNKKPDIRGIITYDKYQVVVANGNETV